MKKLLLLLLFVSQFVFGQTNIAVPSYSATTNSFNSATGNVKFYLGGVSQTVTVGRGANGVCFFGDNMFVAFADGGTPKGILWYSNVSFTNGIFSYDSPVVLTNGHDTFSVTADASGNIYTANNNGTITKFIRAVSAPFYSSANITTATFWNTGSFGDASGVMVDDATSTLWAVSYANNQLATCKLSAFGTDNLKKINTNGAYIQKPEGITKDNLGNIWIGNNNNNYVLRINSAAVNTIISELNASNYTLKTLIEGTNINDFAVSASGHQLGGITYDNLYSSKLYINDQVSGGNSFVYSFTPTNLTPSFTATSMGQIYPGAGQCAILPCALLPNAIASSTTINSGQTANLSANNCVAGASYQWKDGSSIVGTNASFTTPVLNANKTYTVACINSAACSGTPTNVTVTVTPACTTPTNPTSVNANPATINAGATSVLTASGCAAGNTYLWKQGSTQVATTASFTTPTLQSSTTYTAFCVNGSCLSSGSNVTVFVNNPNQLPPSALVGYLHNWDDSGNGLPYIQLDNVPAAYNVINYAFGVAQAGTTDNIQLTLPTNVDANASTRTNTFIQKMNVLQNQGKKVLLSLGGSVSDGGVINVGTTTKRDNFITSVTNLLNTYPFDGLDIDIESGTAANGTSTLIFNQAGMTINTPNSPTIDNLIYALRQIMLNYRSIRGKKMLLTFAPERHHITGGLSSYAYNNIESSAAYLPIITALKDSLDLVHTQLYGYGSDLGKNGNEYCVGTEANALAVTEDLMLGYTLINGQGTFAGLPSNKIALGLATPCNAASVGFLSTTKIQSVVNYFRGTGSQPLAESPVNCSWMTTGQSPYTKISSGAIEFKGLMTWSINYDVNGSCSNNSFANTYTALYGSFVSSANNKNFLTFSFPNQISSVINTTTNTVTVTMPSGTNLASLVPSFTLSANTTTKKLSGVANNFTSPVQYTVNHQDNSSKTWTVIVNVAACSTPANPTAASASPSTINSGQTIIFTASGCASGNTYLWKGRDPAGPPTSIITVSTSASFTLIPLETGIYTAHCVDGACVSSGVNVPITVNTACTTPPNPSSASANPTAINVGQSSTLSATGCPIGTTYKWLYANTLGVASLNATFTDFLYETTNYTVHCVSGSCESSGIPVTVTVGTNIPFSISPTKYFAICQPTATITAAGCGGTVNWYRDVDGSGATNQFLASGNTLTYTTDANWRQYIRATCTVGGVTSPLSNYCTVQTGPEIDPISYIVSPNTPFTLNASGCPASTTYLWSTGETTQSVTKSASIYTLYFVRCVNNTCQSTDGVAYISVGNVIANNDAYNLNIDTPISGNFCNNDGALPSKTIYVDYPPIHGSVVWDNTGAFTYTPTSNYSGTDTFTYYLTNGVGGYSNYATVTLNILCPTALPLSSTNSPSDDFSTGIHKRQASSTNGTISATNKITGTANVNYLAKSIQLNAGFKADNGTVFKAEVGGCN